MENNNDIVSALSPGRLDVMGGIADYSGSLLLQMPIEETTLVELKKNDGNLINIAADFDGGHHEYSIELSVLKHLPYRAARELILAKKEGYWAVYIVGCFLVLEQEKEFSFTGADIIVTGTIPTGKGVSSSAAVEIATMHALQKAYGFMLDPIELALLAQKVENLVAGAACGLMDQLSVNLGRKDHLLPIICQPHHVMEPVKIPAGILFFGLDSGVRHAVSGASYSQVRTAAFMAYTVLLRTLGIESAMMEKARVSQDWDQLPFKGFLANIPLDEFEQQYASKIPETMWGEHFIKDYGSSIDTITVVNPSTEYHLLNAAYHPVRENHRVKRFMELLKQFESSEDKKMVLREMGELMLGSHQGYSSVGLGEPVTQMIVDKVLESGEANGVYGARISGGGSGGTVVIIADTEKGINTVKEIRSFMQKKTGRELYLFSGSSEGAHFINTAN